MLRDPVVAAEIYRREVKHLAARSGADAESTLQRQLEYADSLYRLGQKETAEAEYANVISRRTQTAQTDDSIMRNARMWHARILTELGRHNEAESEWRALAQDWATLNGLTHADTLYALENRAMELHKLGQYEEGVAAMAEVIRLRTASAGPEAEATLNSRASHAAMIRKLGLIAEREAEWRDIFEAKNRVLGFSHAGTLQARVQHAIALYEMDRFEEAKTEFAAAARLMEDTLGPDHGDTEIARSWLQAAQEALRDT